VIHRDGAPYLTRYHLVSFQDIQGRVYLHRFHRSDEDVLHEHPWSFCSLILRGGYGEVTPLDEATCRELGVRGGLQHEWHGVLSFLRRPATWRHRVVIPARLEGRVWTLVWTGPKERSWGFWCSNGWRPWREHLRRREETGDGCA
jgi:hypothetical protein